MTAQVSVERRDLLAGVGEFVSEGIGVGSWVDMGRDSHRWRWLCRLDCSGTGLLRVAEERRALSTTTAGGHEVQACGLAGDRHVEVSVQESRVLVTTRAVLEVARNGWNE